MSLATVDVLPKKTSLQRMVQRKRACPEGHGLIDELRVTQRGEAFFLEEDGQNGFYMFASQKNLDKYVSKYVRVLFFCDKTTDILNSCANWFCDDTFDVAPLVYQLYTIHAVVDQNRTVPLVYAVTENKS